MPCNSNHMHPNLHEIESKKLMELMQGIGLHEGEIPYYGQTSAIHEHTAMLCEFCQETDISKHSLELQIWWRDHQKADEAKLEIKKKQDEEVRKQAKIRQEKQEALSKLTEYERNILGL